MSLFDEKLTEMIRDMVKSEVKIELQKIEAHKNSGEVSDKLLTKTGLKREVFFCGNDTIEDIISEPTFPEGKFYGNLKHPKWSRKEVEIWKENNY